MNAIDIVVIVIIGLCVLLGLYRGFIQSVLNLGGSLISVVGSFWLFPKLSDILSANTGLTRLISTYTDSGSLLGDLGLSSMPVSSLSEQNIASIVERAALPAPIDTLLTHNLSQKVFSPLGDLATTVGDYVNQTILSVSINVLCFLLCFVICFLAVTILVNLIRAVFRFPVLKQLDSVAGGIFGLLRGLLICLVVFTLVPLVQSMVPLDIIEDLLAESTLAPVFMNGNLITAIMNGQL